MRKITEQAALAFKAGRPFSSGNTRVEVDLFRPVKRVGLFLHDNLIAHQTDDVLLLTLAEWPTPTTRERLNGLLIVLDRPEGFWQKNHCQYFGTRNRNVECDPSEWVRVDLLRDAA